MTDETCFSSCAILGDDIYATTPKLVLYKYKDNKWGFCLQSTIGDYSLGILPRGGLVRIGGRNYETNCMTGEVRCLMETPNGKYEWSDKDMPADMHVARRWSAVATNDKIMAVCGGIAADDKDVGSVELLNFQTRMWVKINDLNFAGRNMSAVLNETHLYVSNAYKMFDTAKPKPQLACLELRQLQDTNEVGLKKAAMIGTGSKVIEKKYDMVKWMDIGIDIDDDDLKDRVCPILFKVDPNVFAISGNKLYIYQKQRKKMIVMDTIDTNGYPQGFVKGSAVNIMKDHRILIVGGQYDDSKRQDGTKTVFQLSLVKCTTPN